MSAQVPSIDRLLRAAARAPQGREEQRVPEALVAASLRSLAAAASSAEWSLFMVWLRRGLVFACGLAALVLALNADRMRWQPDDTLNSWNTIANLSWMP